jgi:hypothetical protein
LQYERNRDAFSFDYPADYLLKDESTPEARLLLLL